MSKQDVIISLQFNFEFVKGYIHIHEFPHVFVLQTRLKLGLSREKCSVQCVANSRTNETRSVSVPPRLTHLFTAIQFLGTLVIHIPASSFANYVRIAHVILTSLGFLSTEMRTAALMVGLVEN